jgi:hypothetical protein
MTFETLAWILIILAAADVCITVFLVWATRAVDEPAMTERAMASIILTFAAILWAILGVVFLLNINLASPLPTALLFGGLLLISAPQLIWFVAYWRGVFR